MIFDNRNLEIIFLTNFFITLFNNFLKKTNLYRVL